MTPDEQIQYLRGLQPGEKVIETERSSCMYGKTGVVYISENIGPSFGSLCVKWEDGMGTSVTHGTRRISDTQHTGDRSMFNKPFKLPYMGSEFDCVLVEQHYRNDRLAIEVIDRAEGEPFTTLTVNIPEVPLADDEILVKTWSENETIAPAVLAAFPNHFEDTGRTVPAGHARAAIWKIKGAA